MHTTALPTSESATYRLSLRGSTLTVQELSTQPKELVARTMYSPLSRAMVCGISIVCSEPTNMMRWRCPYIRPRWLLCQDTVQQTGVWPGQVSKMLTIGRCDLNSNQMNACLHSPTNICAPDTPLTSTLHPINVFFCNNNSNRQNIQAH